MPKSRTRKPGRKSPAKPRLAKVHDLLKMEIFACNGEDLLPYWAFHALEEVACQVEPSGRRCFLAAALSEQVFIGVFDLKKGRLCEVLSFRAPSYSRPEVIVDDETLCIRCESRWLQWSTLTWDLLGAHDLEEFEEEDGVTDFHLLPGFRFGWLEVNDDEELYRIVDLQKRRVCRELEGWGSPWLVPGEPLRVVSPSPRDGGLYDLNGAHLSDGYFDDCTSYSTHPDGPYFVAMGATPDDDPLKSLSIVDESGTTVSAELILPGTRGRAQCQLATSRDCGLAFATFWTREGNNELATFAVTGTEMEPLYRIPVGSKSALLQDIHAQHVVLVGPQNDLLHVRPLSRSVPEESTTPEGDVLPDPRELLGCFRLHDEIADEVSERMRSTSKVDERAALRQAFVQEHASNPERLVAFAKQLHLDLPEESTRVDALIQARWKDHSAARLAYAQRSAWYERDWPAVLAFLTRPRTGELSPDHRDHARHLAALAHLWTGNAAAALRVTDGGPETEADACGLNLWRAWAEALLAPMGEEDRSSRPRRLVLGLREADQWLARKDAAGALAALDRNGVWGLKDRQALARYVRAFLLRNDLRGLDRFRARFAMAAFVDQVVPRGMDDGLPWCDLEIPADDLGALAERAADWLYA